MVQRSSRVGQQLGNYRLLRLLGEGGFAEVYLGEHTYLGTHAAIKLLYTRVAQDDIAQFQQEARLLANLTHPHIVRVLDFGVADHTPYLVMDYAPSGTLRARHPKGTCLAMPAVVSYVKQCAQALQYAHDQKIIHRDVKPENMLIGRNGEILLSDFGIALIAQSSRYQSTKDMAGTISYMAPEQIEAHPRPASDRYSLGIVTYEWLSGNRPFHGSFTEIAVKHSVMPPPSLCQQLPDLSPEIEQVVFTALAKKPEDRFKSVQAFATALEQASQTKPLTPVPPRSKPQPPKPTPPPVPLQPNPVPFEPPLPPTSTVPASPVTPVQTPSEVNTPAVQPFPSTVPAGAATPADAQPGWVYMAPEQIKRPPTRIPPTPKPQLAFQLQLQLTRRKVLIGLAATGVVAASGGITWLAISCSPSKRHHSTIPTLTPQSSPTPHPLGALLFTYEGHSGSVYAVSWSPDGNRMASGSTDETVQVWNAVDGGNVYTYKGHSDAVFAVAWLPDGIASLLVLGTRRCRCEMQPTEAKSTRIRGILMQCLQ